MSAPAQDSVLTDLRSGLRFADSYTRIPTLIRAFVPCAKVGTDALLEWFRLLGDEWSGCDNIGKYRHDLNLILANATDEQRAAMMTDAEREELARLPSTFTVYRGAYSVNRRGLSWSLSRHVAAGFPFLARYALHCVGHRPILLTGRARRDRCVLKLDRDEQEIVAANMRIVESEILPIPELQQRAAA
ncbi:MAG: hypothetical protein ACPGJF_05665 [Sinimarinibacterium flocculans]|uniref:hypothetical protein n=1 Tax=Sinimarinibacterium flocculans TaxID=985250 RepID=UPI003C60AE2C